MKHVVKCMVSNLDGEILLIKRAEDDSHAGYWETPGGGVDGDETLVDACIREVKEETGLTLTEQPLFGKTVVLADDETGDEYSVHLFYVEQEGTDTDISDNPDHDDLTWVEASTLILGQFDVDSWTKRHIQETFDIVA